MEHETLPTRAPQLEQLVLDAVQDMQRLGYSPKYLRLCRGVWRDFLSFARSGPIPEALSDPSVARFLASRGIPADDAPALTSRQRLIRAVMRILVEFKLHGCYQRRSRTARSVSLSAPFQASLDTYGAFCRSHLRCTPGTMRCRTRHLTRFLHFLESHQTREPSAIRATHIPDFLRSQIHLRPKTLALIVSDLRSFLRFLCMQGALSEDLSGRVPQVRVARDGRLPSIWSGTDLEALLAAVDRASPKGKRDYAILLLACRLGLRVSDIRGLCLEHLHRREDRIEMTQTKTEVPLSLPLGEELGGALIDYLRHGRPVTHHREVFLRLKAPVEPFSSNDNLHHILTFYRQRAGIALPAQARKGLHSLRHTLATRLLEVGTPLETIAGILGHLSPESTQIYAKVDIEALRRAALDPEVFHE